MDDLTQSAPALPEEPSAVEAEPAQEGTPPKGLKVFESVKNMLETVQKVGWKDAVSSMDYASQYIITCEVAQNFVATYMQQIISILLDQDFVKLNSMNFERNCVEQSLHNAIKVVANDLKRAVGSNSTSSLLTTLGMVFNPGRLFYQKHKNSWNSSSSASNDGFRLNLISCFTSIGGMASLVSYIKARSPEELLDTSKIGLETLNYLLLGAEISLRLKYVRPSTPPPKSPYETPPPTPERTSNVAIASPPPTPVSPSTPSAAKPATDPLKANLSLINHKLISILLTTPESELKSLTPDSISEVISTIQTLYTSLLLGKCRYLLSAQL